MSLSFGDQKLKSQPGIFRKKNIKSVSVRYFDFWGDGKYTAEGSIEFKSGSFAGEQKFTGLTFDHVVKKMKDTIAGLPG